MAYIFRRHWQLALLAACFSFGIILGCVFAMFSCTGTNLEGYLTDYLTLVAVDGVVISPVTVFWNCFRWPLLAGIFLLTAIGIFVIPVLTLLRGFFLAFTTICLGMVYGYDGLSISVVLFAVTVLLELPSMFVLYCEFLRCSRSCFGYGNTASRVTLRPEVLLVGVGAFILSSALQLTVIPGLFTAVCERIFM